MISNIVFFAASNCQEGTCEPQFLEQCIKMADPLLKEPKHVFPTNSEDIDHVCKYGIAFKQF